MSIGLFTGIGKFRELKLNPRARLTAVKCRLTSPPAVASATRLASRLSAKRKMPVVPVFEYVPSGDSTADARMVWSNCQVISLPVPTIGELGVPAPSTHESSDSQSTRKSPTPRGKSGL